MQQLRMSTAAVGRAAARPVAAMAQRPAAAAPQRRRQHVQQAQQQRPEQQHQQQQQQTGQRIASVLGAAALSLGLMLSSPALPPAHAGPQVRAEPRASTAAGAGRQQGRALFARSRRRPRGPRPASQLALTCLALPLR